jgi:hypothetical protein
MKSFRSFFILPAILFFSQSAFSQFRVYGSVVDSSTREPLYGASVFCQNTTSGTASSKQGEFSMQLKPGGYELIISFTGYQTKTVQITSKDTARMTIPLSKEEKSMGEVIIRSSNEVTDGWDKYGKFFIENFIGTSPNAAFCTLENPQALKFYFFKRSDKLKVLATEALVVTNKALGYQLHYQLDSFVYYNKTEISSYRGYCLFTEMSGNFEEMKKWSSNRKAAYYGSRLHFMRAYYDSTLKDEDFLIGMLDSTNETKFNPIKDPYDSTLYSGVTDSLREAEIFFPRKVSVSYLRKPEKEYLRRFKLPDNLAIQTSYIELLDPIAIRENGFFYNQKDLVSQGYWSWKNLADLLPYDYIP